MSTGNPTASIDELKNALKETLEARGVMGQIKAQIRAEIFQAIDDQDVPKPKLSQENTIINELIREYLEYNGYGHTLSVFLPESGHPQVHPFDRKFLALELNVQENSRNEQIPLLYGIVSSLQDPDQGDKTKVTRTNQANMENMSNNVMQELRNQAQQGFHSSPSKDIIISKDVFSSTDFHQANTPGLFSFTK